MTFQRSTSSPTPIGHGTSVVARAQRRAGAAALQRGATVGLAFDPTSGTYRLGLSQTV
jgi:hypothetical protein